MEIMRHSALQIFRPPALLAAPVFQNSHGNHDATTTNNNNNNHNNNIINNNN